MMTTEIPKVKPEIHLVMMVTVMTSPCWPSMLTLPLSNDDDDDDDDDIDKVDGLEVEEAYRVEGDTRPQDVRVRLVLSSSLSS